MADIDMDIDMDIDLSIDPEIAELEAEAMVIAARAAETSAKQQQEAPQTTSANGTGNGTGTGNGAGAGEAVDQSAQPEPCKVLINGTENMTEDDVKSFAFEHYSQDEYRRIEWIGDNEAKIVYGTEQAGAEALMSLSDLDHASPDQLSPLQLRKAKVYSQKPDIQLFVRQATLSDVKVPKARLYSRFYLNHPEYDRHEQRRNDRGRDYGRRGRGYGREAGRDYERGYGRDGRRGGRRDDRREERNNPVQTKAFDVSMYDDDAGDEELDERLPQKTDRYGPARLQGDLFADKKEGRLRDRSASPVREGDGRFGFDEDQPVRRTARRRSVTPPPRRRDIQAQAKAPVELFPNKVQVSAFDPPLTAAQAGPDLFAKRHEPNKRSRELFPNRTPHSNHRRQNALDPNETTGARLTLADRIGPLPGTADVSSGDQGFSIRGSATDTSHGFYIRGASKDVHPRVKELFPEKVNGGAAANSGDLFADKLKARNSNRRQAADFF